MERTTIYRIYGSNKELGEMVANTLAQPEIKKLRAQIGAIKNVRSKEIAKKIAEAREKYESPIMPEWKQKLWGIIGLIVLVVQEGWK